jgi:S-adenosylmethionine synthetase
LAKNVVAAGLASRCTIQIAYAIGVAEPVSLYANTHDTGKVDDQKLREVLRDCMDLTPRGIRQHLGMNAPIYASTAAYGHFGRTAGEAGSGTFSWEATDLVDVLRAAAL